MSARWRRTLLVLLTLALSGVTVAASEGYTASVAVTRQVTAGPLPDGFVGLALEFDTIPRWVGQRRRRPINPVLVQLIRNLDPAGRPVIRIGGQSTDRAWWPVPGQNKPIGVTYALSQQWTHAAHLLAQALDARLIPGVNLEADRPILDKVEARHLIAGIGRQYIEAIEIGNEPDLYTRDPLVQAARRAEAPVVRPQRLARLLAPADLQPHRLRRRLVARRARDAGRAARRARRPARSPGCRTSRRGSSRRGSQLRILTSHAYGLNNCVTNPSSPAYPSVPNLLSPYASRTLFDGGSELRQPRAPRRRQLPDRRDGLDHVQRQARRERHDGLGAVGARLPVLARGRPGIDGVNLHTYPNSDNGLFDFAQTGGQWSAIVHPLYYGALMFAQAAPPESRLLRATTSGPTDLRAWATEGPGDVVRIVLINDSLNQSATVAVQPPAGVLAPIGTLERLAAPSAYATGQISIGGRSFGAQTTSGALQAPVPQTATSSARVFRVTLPAASAALLTLTAPPAAN